MHDGGFWLCVFGCCVVLVFVFVFLRRTGPMTAAAGTLESWALRSFLILISFGFFKGTTNQVGYINARYAKALVL